MLLLSKILFTFKRETKKKPRDKQESNIIYFLFQKPSP
jgi:hypothetical protein